MASAQPVPPEDRLIADTFGASYREFQESKAASYRWGHLAPEGAAWVARSIEEKWSEEKLADYLHCDADEAARCRKRYAMSKKINGSAAAAERFRRAAYEWIGEVAELDDAMRRRLSQELARLIGNQIYAALGEGEDVMELSRALAEGRDEPSSGSRPGGAPGERPSWGPQWKD